MINAEFVASAFCGRDFPRVGLPEIVVAGRSNVGKSSLINCLAGNRKLARTSSTPGKTQSINFYRFERTFCLVDLPGFGYAKAGKAESRKWKRLTEEYFRERESVVLALQLVDGRRPPTNLDLELAGWLQSLGIPRVVLATKADKLSGNERAVQQRKIADQLGGEAIFFSAVTGAGRVETWRRLNDAVQQWQILERSQKVKL